MKMIKPLLALSLFASLSLSQGLPAKAQLEAKSDIGTSNDITSGEDLDKLILQLNDSTTEMAALRKLIKFTRMDLYNRTMIYPNEDPKEQELRPLAVQAVRAHRNLESVRRALDDDDRDVRFWGVASFEIAYGRRTPWEPLLPRLQEIASQDRDSGIRCMAIEKLLYYERATAFLTTLQASTNETNPEVLMRLLRFDSQKPEPRAHWYARAVEILSGKDEALRLQWVSYIWFNAWNPSTAPMWRIEGDPALVGSLRQIEQMGSQKEKEFASKALHALAMEQRTSAQPDGAANRSQPARTETNQTPPAAGPDR